LGNLGLHDIAVECGTDKVSHKYPLLYEKYFESLRHKPIRILEIGVKYGQSLKLWERYFTKAEIYGIDRVRNCEKYKSVRTRIFIGNQSDVIFLDQVIKSIGDKLDIIIDDGGHQMVEQQTSLQVLFPNLNSGGIYVIEDLHTSYRETHNGGFHLETTTIEFLKTFFDSINFRFHKNKSSYMDGKLFSFHMYESICFLFKR